LILFFGTSTRDRRSTGAARPTPDIFRKQGGVIPGIDRGPTTEKYLGQGCLNRITRRGALFLAAIALTPLVVFAVRGTSDNSRSAAHER